MILSLPRSVPPTLTLPPILNVDGMEVFSKVLGAPSVCRFCQCCNRRIAVEVLQKRHLWMLLTFGRLLDAARDVAQKIESRNHSVISCGFAVDGFDEGFGERTMSPFGVLQTHFTAFA